MVVFVNLRKRDKDGDLPMHLTFPFAATPYISIADIPKKKLASLSLHLGSYGVLRASHASYDAQPSIHENFPFHPHDKGGKITPGEITRLEVGIWVMASTMTPASQSPSKSEGNFPASRFPRRGLRLVRRRRRTREHIGFNHSSGVILPLVPL
jgi:hypothetical protein